MTSPDLSASLGDPSQGKLSAEERLFQVIQSGGEPPEQEQGGSFKKFFRKISSAFKRKKRHSVQKSEAGSGLARLNKIVGVVIVMGGILSVANLFYFKPDIKWVYSRVAGTHAAAGHTDLKAVPIEELLTPITSRSLFRPKTEEAPPAPAADAAPVAAAPGSAAAMDTLQLVGIAFGTNPEAMIREKKGGRTYFLKQGEQINGVVVKEIQKDRVIVECAGQTKELM